MYLTFFAIMLISLFFLGYTPRNPIDERGTPA